jgi:hypothetical protein
MTAHNLAVLSVVLETFQTYYAFSRAVNPRISIKTGEHWALDAMVRKIVLTTESLNARKVCFLRFRVFRASVVNRLLGDSRGANAQHAAPVGFVADFRTQRH